MPLTNNLALVCGSTQGIGKAVAIGLAKMGASITLVARNEDSLKQTLEELDKSKGQKHGYMQADFQDPIALKSKLSNLLADNRKYSILVNNTGGPKGGLLIDAELEEFESAYTAHLKCNHILAQALVPGMKDMKFGRIVNIISTSVKQPILGLGVSNTTRGAVANWAKTLSMELGQYGITVNNVLPGFTMTARLEAIIKSKMEKTGQSQSEIEAEMLSEVPARRFAQAHEIASAVCYLASPEAAYINGINVPVDGGRTSCL